MEVWSIKTIYQQAWHITKQHKKLWILGVAMMLFAGGGGSSYRSSSNSSQQNQQETAQVEAQTSVSPVQQQFLENTTTTTEDSNESNLTVLGPLAGTVDQFPTALASLGPVWWLLLIIEVAIFIGYAIVFALTARTWAQAALTLAIDQVAKNPNQELALTKPSLEALTRVKALIWLQIIPGLKFALIGLGVLVAGGIVMFLANMISTSLGGLIIFLVVAGWIIAAIYYGITFIVAITWAQFKCILENISGQKAFADSWQHVKGTRRKAIRLGFANFLVGVGAQLLGLVILLPLLFLVAPSFQNFANLSTSLTPTVIATLLVGGLAVASYYMVAGIIMSVFVQSSWYLAYLFISQNHAK